MKRNICVVLALAVAGASSNSFALGLGDIKLHSALGQRLEADIPLIGTRKGELNNASIKLASTNAFQHAGIERADILSQLQFKIARGTDGKPLVKITSDQPIDEPFLDFLVVANWSSGQLEREYTVLLNPPSFESSAGSAFSSARQGAQAPQTNGNRGSGVKITNAPTSKLASAHPIPVTAGSYGPVKRGETLGEIAARLRSDDSVSLNQMMIAIYRANPNAFMGNINSLKAGYGVKRPAASLLHALNPIQARNAVLRQNKAWQIGQPALVGKVAAAAVSTSSAKSSDPTSRADSSPKLVPAVMTTLANKQAQKADTVPVDPVQSEAVDQKVVQLQQEVTATRQQNERVTNQNKGLRARIDQLRQKLHKVQRQLEAKTRRLADMQRRDVNLQARATSANAQRTGPWLLKPLNLGLMLGALLLLLIVLAVRRRRLDEAHARAVQLEAEQSAGGIEANEEPALRESGDGKDRPADESTIATALATSAAIARAPLNEPDAQGSHEDERERHAQNDGIVVGTLEASDQSDPITNADFHMTYGLYEQAADIVREALVLEPARGDLQLKLLEIYFATGDRKAFIAAAKDYQDTLDMRSWEQVLVMGRDLAPNESVFMSTDRAPASVIDFPFDTASSANATTQEVSADLDVDLSEQETQVQPTSKSDAYAQDDDDSIDFDISSLELDTTSETQSDPVKDLPESERSLGTAVAEGENEVDLERAFSELSAYVGADDQDENQPETNALALESDVATSLDHDDADDGLGAISTKLDLARAYLDMDDAEGARTILEEVIDEGTSVQQHEAEGLMKKIA